MAEPLVSVVLPTYKRAHSLAATIDSVCNQTYANWELIVVDDNDRSGPHGQDTRDVVTRYQSRPNVVFISDGVNRGACAARNAGVASAKGEFVAFLDDDDIWAENKLELQLRALRDEPQAGFSFCDLVRVDHTDNTETPITYRFDMDDLFRSLLKNGAGICSSALVIRRDLLVAMGGFDDSLPSYQDYDLLLRLSLCAKAVAIGAPLLSYHVFADGISRNYEAKFAGKKIIIEKYGKYFADRSLARYYGFHLGVIGDYAILHGRRWAAAKYYALSILKWPLAAVPYAKLLITLLGGEKLYRFASDRRQKMRRSGAR